MDFPEEAVSSVSLQVLTRLITCTLSCLQFQSLSWCGRYYFPLFAIIACFGLPAFSGAPYPVEEKAKFLRPIART